MVTFIIIVTIFTDLCGASEHALCGASEHAFPECPVQLQWERARKKSTGGVISIATIVISTTVIVMTKITIVFIVAIIICSLYQILPAR